MFVDLFAPPYSLSFSAAAAMASPIKPSVNRAAKAGMGVQPFPRIHKNNNIFSRANPN